MSKPVFSVIMPAYNAQETIGAAIESVLNQTFQKYELLVVNDCSEDRTSMIIESYYQKDNRIRLFQNKENLGVAESRNRALKKAQGQYIAFLDSDDLWLPSKLEVQYKYFKQGYDLLYGSYLTFGQGGERIIRAPINGTYKTLLRGNFIGNLTGAYDRAALGIEYQKNIGHEDYLMWLKLMDRSDRSLGIQEVLARYRISKSSLSSNKVKSAIWTWSIYRNEVGKSFFPALCLFFLYMINGVKKRF